MIRNLKILARILAACLFVLSMEGCGNSGTTSDSIGSAKPDDRQELVAVLQAFKEEDVSMRSTVEELAQMVRSGMIQDALPGLTKFSTNPKLNPEQKQALDNLITSLKTK